MAQTRAEKVKKLESFQAAAERAKGKAEAAIATLKEAGYPTRQSAVAALEDLQEKIATETAEFDRDYAEFEQVWEKKNSPE